jgi:hypothetical protein
VGSGVIEHSIAAATTGSLATARGIASRFVSSMSSSTITPFTQAANPSPTNPNRTISSSTTKQNQPTSTNPTSTSITSTTPTNTYQSKSTIFRPREKGGAGAVNPWLATRVQGTLGPLQGKRRDTMTGTPWFMAV